MECSFAAVSTKHCQELRLALLNKKLADSERQCIKICDKIGIPLKQNFEQNTDIICSQDGYFILNDIAFCVIKKKIDMSSKKSTSNAQKLKEELSTVMQNKGLWHVKLETEIPVSWEKYNDLILINSDKYFKSSAWYEAGPDLWIRMCNILNVDRIALKSNISPDGFRTPKVNLIWGKSSIVQCTDNGIRYNWDVTKNMFCAGNAPERHRIAKLKCDGEVVVDLYAGIGYFTLPYLVHAKAKLVHACEWNPDAVNALRNNLIANNVEKRCIVHEGDNRKVLLSNIADRVNLGLIPSSKDGWRVACKALKSSTGGVLHIHENVTSGMNKCTSNNGNVQEDLSLCSECRHLLNCIKSDKFVYGGSHKQSFFIDNNRLSISNVPINWKRVEWKFWAVHVLHCISSTLHEVHKVKWKLSVVHLHRVKSYAPHIDHLVLDLHCYPVPL
ncbi:tRNA wybutosine-synthesizing protein 2 homolog isoform X1 [Periplaneta americana]|uniref:tRNA wybutosine-synthesizing protein 2 homolog isoform X1 n=1 Tax=Periplaneta americana TaxID=6978 RepID=UPI0037E7575F